MILHPTAWQRRNDGSGWRRRPEPHRERAAPRGPPPPNRGQWLAAFFHFFLQILAFWTCALGYRLLFLSPWPLHPKGSWWFSWRPWRSPEKWVACRSARRAAYPTTVTSAR